jgi:hypothetical protein
MPKKDTYCGIPTKARQCDKTNGLWMMIDDAHDLTASERKRIVRWFKGMKDKPGVLIIPASVLKRDTPDKRERR